MKSLFSSFDVFPSAKGAGSHIYHTLQAIKDTASAVTIYCLGHPEMPTIQEEDNILIHRCLAIHPNFLKRVELFNQFLFENLSKEEEQYEIIHFRDIWSGIALSLHPRTKNAKMIYEVNGFASIELPLRYPHLLNNKKLLRKIKQSEDFLLQKADKIITVSRTNADYIIKRGADKDKITVIPNAAANSDNEEKVEIDKNLIVYIGTLSPWQGLPVLLQSLKMISHKKKLFIASSTKKHLKYIRKYIRKLDLEERVEIKIALPKEEIKKLLAKAFFSVAPLTRCDRNELQGCCPIKILESMAEKTPVIASNLAVNREIITDNENGLLFTPDSPRSLAYQMESLFNNNSKRDYLAQNGYNNIKNNFNTTLFTTNLKRIYTQLLEVKS